jgi:membrane protease YdiL (CAAX protease family)
MHGLHEDPSDGAAPLRTPPPSPTDLRQHRETRFGPGRAFVLLIIYVAVVFFTTLLVTVVALAISVRGAPLTHPTMVAHIKQQLFAPALLISSLTGMTIVVWLSRVWGQDRLHNTSATGFAWVLAPFHTLLLGAASGALLAVTNRLVIIRWFPMPGYAPVGPMVQLSMTPGFPRFVWLVTVLMLAPVFEEYLFRGVLLGIFVTRWGIVVSSVAVTLLFTLLHLLETRLFWPVLMFIGALSLLLIVLRLHCRSLAPCVVAHLCYNSVLAAFLALAR